MEDIDYLENFDPNSISNDDMVSMAESLEQYVDMLEHIVQIPKELRKEIEGNYKSAMKRVKQLISKLRKGDRSVFKNYED